MVKMDPVSAATKDIS